MKTPPCAALRADTQPRLSSTGTSLPIDGPLLIYDRPVEIGKSLWGPFHRLYLQAQAEGHTHTVCTGPFTAQLLSDGVVRIATILHVPTGTGAIRADIAMLRAASGELLKTELVGPPEAGPDAAAMLEAVRKGLSHPAGGFLARRSLHVGDLFEIGTMGTGTVPLLCRVLGQSSHQGRAVLVARCTGTQPVAEGNWAGLVTADGHVAVDIETGVIILSALQCRVSGTAAPTPEVCLQAWFRLRQDRSAASWPNSGNTFS